MATMKKNLYKDILFTQNFNFFKVALPEVDTIRFAIPYHKYMFDVEEFIAGEFQNRIAACQKWVDFEGNEVYDQLGRPEVVTTWSKERIDGKNSWYGKMQIFKGKIGSDFDKNAPIALIIEYSVAKWHNITNGVNRGVQASFEDCFDPIFDVLMSFNAIKYSRWCIKKDGTCDVERFKDWIQDNIVLRRLDLSYNFKVKNVDVAMRKLATCRLNNLDPDNRPGKVDLDKVEDDFKFLKKIKNRISINEFEQQMQELKNGLVDAASKFETVSFGGGRGNMYKLMFYDKAKEQRKYFSNYVNCAADPITKMNDLRNRKNFYKKNKLFFEKIIRFEIQYNSKFFIEKVGSSDYKWKKGRKMFDNLIYICENHWAQTLKKFDEQLGINVNEHLDRYENLEKVMNHLQTLAEVGTISHTVANNLQGFIQQCWKFPGGWKGVRNHIGKASFSLKYKKLKQLTNFDIKRESLREQPIMRAMSTMGLCNGNYWLTRAENDIYFDYGNYVKFA